MMIVFANALTDHLQFPNTSKDSCYIIYLLIFAVFMCPLICMGFSTFVYTSFNCLDP